MGGLPHQRITVTYPWGTRTMDERFNKTIHFGTEDYVGSISYTLTLQHDVKAPIAETPTFSCNILHGFAQFGIVWPDAAMPHARPVYLQHIARPPLAHPVLITQMNHRFPLCRGRHHFFEFTSSAWGYPASVLPEASSAWRSRLRAPSVCGHLKRPSRQTSICICRTTLC